MTTDTTWTWTFLMRDGKSWHVHKSVTLEDALRIFFAQGFEQTEIEVIVRH